MSTLSHRYKIERFLPLRIAVIASLRKRLKTRRPFLFLPARCAFSQPALISPLPYRKPAVRPPSQQTAAPNLLLTQQQHATAFLSYLQTNASHPRSPSKPCPAPVSPSSENSPCATSSSSPCGDSKATTYDVLLRTAPDLQPTAADPVQQPRASDSIPPPLVISKLIL